MTPFKQPAIDALHRRSSQLSLREYNDGQPPFVSGSDNRKQQQINRLLAKYLEKEEQEEEEERVAASQLNDEYPDLNNLNERAWLEEQRKRSIFRERTGDDDENDDQNASPYPSVFRERGNARSHHSINPELAREFLKEIDRERNIIQEQKYRQNLARALKQYENDEENETEQNAIADGLQRERLQILGDKELPINLHREEVVPNWSSEVDKRQMSLPWLSAPKNKRIPIAKRSPRDFSTGVSDKVAHDLEAIFGELNDNKKPLAHVGLHKVEKKSGNMNHHHGGDTHPVDPSQEHEHDNGDEEEEYEEEDDSDSEFDDDDDDKKKKKRSTKKATKSILDSSKSNKTEPKSSPEEFKIEQIIGNGISNDENNVKQKKSIQWSKYFGLDRKKKSSDDWYMSKHG